MMESSVVERKDPESENRLSLGGKKRSSRRSSILKAGKSPMKALEDIDANSMADNKENRDSMSRRSSSRRVSFAMTYEVKEFCKDEEWNLCQKANLTDGNIDQQVEKAEYLPSGYRQPSVTSKGLESLLKGDIQNTELPKQENPDMDFTEYYNKNVHGEADSHQSDLNRTNTINRADNNDTNALDLTCHGQDLIDQGNLQTGLTTEQLQYNATYNQTTASKYDDMDFTVCQARKSEDEITYQSACERTMLLTASNNSDMNALDLTCDGRGIISNTDSQTSCGAETTSFKFSASSFIQSLGQSKAKHPQENEMSSQQPRHSFSSRSSQPQTMSQETERIDTSGFLLSLSTPKPQQHSSSLAPNQVCQQNVSSKSNFNENSFIQGPLEPVPTTHASTSHHCHEVEEEEDMEMTTCIDVQPDTSNAEVSGNAHCPPSCVPKAQTLPEAEMDMTTCVPPTSTVHERSMVPEAQMDMKTCVPPTSRVHERSMVPEAQMDMTTCVPPTSKVHELSLSQNAQMNATSCEPLSPPLEKKEVSDDQHEEDKIEDEPSGQEVHLTTLKDNSDVSSPPSCPKEYLNNRKRSSPATVKTATTPVLNTTQDEDIPDEFGHIEQRKFDSFYNFKAQENQTQSWLNRTLPLLSSQTTKKSNFTSLPSLSMYLIGGKEPQITHGPVCDIPTSKFCSQSAKKRKMTHNIELETKGVTKQVDCTADDHTFVLQKKEEKMLEEQRQTANTATNSQTDENTLDKSVHYDEDADDSDGEISFKAGHSAEDQVNTTETLALHSSMVGFMEEPTLEFASDVLNDVDDNNVIAITESNSGKEEGTALKQDIPEQSLLESKKLERNLSTISEESDVECNKAVSLQASMDGNHEKVIEKKKMTVAELLKRASISFNCAIEQVSRRSTFGYIKKPEQPKEEKEFMQLSMALKPQATHYSEYCANIQHELGQLKTKTEQQEQALNSSDTPILYCTSENEMTDLETKLKELKKSVCKKCANARWIERTGVMKKKLASVLKSNHDVISSDVSTVNESLAVAKDCDKVIDSIDEELEKGIQALREIVHKDYKESEDVEEVKTALKQKTTELAARETELQQVEERRSCLISTKESLTAEKQNLEREKLESEMLLAKATKEISREEDVEKLTEKYDLLKWCLEWELDEWDHQHAKFLFLNKTLELLVTFDDNPDVKVSKTVKNICLSSLLADNIHQSAKFSHSLILGCLDSSGLVQMSPTSSSLSKVLNHVSRVVSTARSLEDELFDIFFKYLTTVNESRVSVVFSSIEAFMKFIVELDIDVVKYPENVGITVTQKIGKPCCQDIEDTLQAVPISPRYITSLINTARQFMEKKSC